MRPKPAVADSNRENAIANVETKKAFLTTATLRMTANEPTSAEAFEVTRRLSASLPTSLRQFNVWTSESFIAWGEPDWPRFTRNAQKTLVVNKKVEIVQKSIDLALAARTKFLTAPDQAKQDRVSGLKSRLKDRQTLLDISEDTLKAELTKSAALKRKIVLLQKEVVDVTAEFKKKIKQKDEEIAGLRKALGDLKIVVPFSKNVG